MKPILPMRGLGLLALSMLTACAQFGNQAPLDAPTAYSLPQGSQPQAAKADWWLDLGDSMLNRLMAQTLMLAARGKGLDSCPMDGFDFDAVAKLINLPDNHVIALMVAVGKKTLEPKPRIGKLPVTEVIIRDRF